MSRHDMHALRRTPPSEAAPYATQPPVLRVLYAYCTDSADEEIAVVLLGGDKTRLGNLWYLPNVTEAGHRLDQYCRHHTDLKAIMKRGSR